MDNCHHLKYKWKNDDFLAFLFLETFQCIQCVAMWKFRPKYQLDICEKVTVAKPLIVHYFELR